MSDEYGSVEWAGKFSTKFSGLRETVPDTQDDILWDKICKSIGVYSGVYEYTANWGFAELQAGSLQCNGLLSLGPTPSSFIGGSESVKVFEGQGY
jgi:hypothetical protein